MDKELIKVIYQGDLDKFIEMIHNSKLRTAYVYENGEYNERIRKFFKDLTRRVTNPAYLEMLLCDLYNVKTLYDYIELIEVMNE